MQSSLSVLIITITVNLSVMASDMASAIISLSRDLNILGDRITPVVGKGPSEGGASGSSFVSVLSKLDKLANQGCHSRLEKSIVGIVEGWEKDLAVVRSPPPDGYLKALDTLVRKWCLDKDIVRVIKPCAKYYAPEIRSTLSYLGANLDSSYGELSGVLRTRYASIVRRLEGKNYLPYEKTNWNIVSKDHYNPQELFAYITRSPKSQLFLAPSLVVTINCAYVYNREDEAIVKLMNACISAVVTWGLPHTVLSELVALVSKQFDLKNNLQALRDMLHFAPVLPIDEPSYALEHAVNKIIDSIRGQLELKNVTDPWVHELAFLMLLLWTNPEE